MALQIEKNSGRCSDSRKRRSQDRARVRPVAPASRPSHAPTAVHPRHTRPPLRHTPGARSRCASVGEQPDADDVAAVRAILPAPVHCPYTDTTPAQPSPRPAVQLGSQPDGQIATQGDSCLAAREIPPPPLLVLSAPCPLVAPAYASSRRTCSTQAASTALKNSPLRLRLHGPTSQQARSATLAGATSSPRA